ncbi:Ankyrin repeat-containing protein NPR4 [Bienertia sinuspersici]
MKDKLRDNQKRKRKGEVEKEEKSNSNSNSKSKSKSKSPTREKANIMLVVATLMIGACYSAIVNLPGGYDGDTGIPVLLSSGGKFRFLFAYFKFGKEFEKIMRSMIPGGGPKFQSLSIDPEEDNI